MSFNFPVRLSIIHTLVRKESLTTAISVNAIAFNIARIGGPELSGQIIVQLGIGLATDFTVLADLIFVFMLYLIKIANEDGAKKTKTFNQSLERHNRRFQICHDTFRHWPPAGYTSLLFNFWSTVHRTIPGLRRRDIRPRG